MDPTTDDPYEILGLAPDPHQYCSTRRGAADRAPIATDTKTIRAAYRRLALLHHPDKQTDPASRERAHTTFAKISHAYEVLTDPEQRHAWEEAQQLQRVRQRAPDDDDTVRQPTQFHFHDPFAVFESVFRQEFGNHGGGFAHSTFPGRSMGGGLFGDHNSFFGGGNPFANDPFFNSGGQRRQHPFGGSAPVPRDPFDGFFGGSSSPFFGGGGLGAGGFNDVFSSMRQMQEQMMQHQQQLPMNNNNNNNRNQYTSYSTTSRTIQNNNGDLVTTTETTRIVNGQEQTTREIVTQRPDGTVVDRQQFLEGGNDGNVEATTAALPSSSSSRPRDATSAATTMPNSAPKRRRRLPWSKGHEEEEKKE